MLCIQQDQAFPCGQCLNCRINAQRVWVARMLLELQCHRAAIFVTLTYSDDNVPFDGTHLQLRPRDVTLFWKRLRKKATVRYFLCGEYGDETWRPHYHAVVFGLAFEDCVKVGRFHVHPLVQEAWNLGFTSAAPMTEERAAYCAQYTVKKLTKSTSEDTYEGRRLDGRHPEFMRSSRRPGIGGSDELVESFCMSLLDADPEALDVPTEFRLDGRTWPVPTYFAQRLRRELGMPRLAKDRPPRRVVDHSQVDVAELTREATAAERRARARYYRRRRRRQVEGNEL